MGLNFAAVLGHGIEAEDLRTLPHRLSAARAPRLAEAIIELTMRGAEYYGKRDTKQPTLDDLNEENWFVQPTRLALYRDIAGNLTSQMPPVIERKIGPNRWRGHLAPVAAWRMVSVKEYWAAGNWFDVQGYINLAIGPHALGLSCSLRWWTFLTASAMQAATRRVCQEVARLFGSPLAIYVFDARTPIDAIVKGSTIEEIVAQLHAKLGRPGPALTVLDDESMPDNGGRDTYYLDTFAGL